ncbi:MAG: hypothetical protein IH571_01485, partial [Acholeplasmataceae bacterium]|nr:hypothetical protein [Acholeplasmataceae bacterium]
VDYILDHQFEDGGWNCEWETKDPKSSSLHTTLSVLEGFSDYLENTYVYRLQDIKNAIPKGQAFILKKHLFRSVKTNEIINQAFLNCPFPSRWKYDILRALTYFAYVKHPYDIRMEEAIQILEEKMRADGTMPKDKAHAGKMHFMLESGRNQSRWNTFRMLFVLKAYRPERYHVLVHH